MNLITYNEIILDAKHFCLLFRLFKIMIYDDKMHYHP